MIPIQLPIGEERNFKGVIDLVAMKACVFATDGSGKPVDGAIPGDMIGSANAAREALIEMVAEADDALMEKFFDAGTLEPGRSRRRVEARRRRGADLPRRAHLGGGQHRHPATARRDRRLRAVAGGTSAARAHGGRRGGRDRDEGRRRRRAAFVWKTVADPFAGRITLFRVLSGTLKADSSLHNVTKDTPERLGHLILLQGKTQTNVPEIKAGDIGAVAKLKETQTSDVLADKAAAAVVPPIKFPEPVISYAIEPKSRGDEEKISTALHRLQEEDPTINYTRDAQTKELLLAGQGQSHIEVTVAKLKRRFGVEVTLKLPRIPYRETIKATVEAHGRHKKQTGGHGQFGDCKVKFEPLPSGSDFEFVNDIFGGSIPRQFVPAIEKGIQDSRMRGFLAGYPMVDFRASVFDGSFHPVDSSEMSFKMAGSLAFKDGMSRARPTLLEPIMNVEVYAPSDYAGDLMGDLNSRRGRIGGMDTRGAMTVIRAKVPMQEMLTYEQHLTSATGGRGSYHMEFDHYEEVPSHLHAKIIAASKAERGQEAAEEVTLQTADCRMPITDCDLMDDRNEAGSVSHRPFHLQSGSLQLR